MKEKDEYRPVIERRSYRNTIGSIVTGAIFRTAFIIILALFLYDYFKWVDYALWWSITAVSIYAFVVHPMQVQYRLFKEDTSEITTNSLCAKCKHFEPSGILCAVLDEHVTEDYIPCEGAMWEPKSLDLNEDDG